MIGSGVYGRGKPRCAKSIATAIAVLNARHAGIASKAGVSGLLQFSAKAAKTLFGIDTIQ
jgi:hypothetical protein